MNKKLAAAFAAIFILTGLLTGCSSSDSSDAAENKRSSSRSRVSEDHSIEKYNENDNAPRSDDEDNNDTVPAIENFTDSGKDAIPESPIGGDITGSWDMTDKSSGEIITLMLEKNGSGSVYIDLCKYIFFTKEKRLYLLGMETNENSVQFDGATLTATLETDLLGRKFKELAKGNVLLTLEKVEPGSPDDLNGDYRFTGGEAWKYLTENYLDKITGGRDIPVFARISNEDFGIKIDEIFSYTAEETTLTLSGASGILSEAKGNIGYSVYDDKLILYYPTGGTAVLERSNLK